MAIKRLSLGDVFALLAGSGLSSLGGQFLGNLVNTAGIGSEASANEVSSKYPTTKMGVRLLPASGNATLQRQTAQDASRMQTLREHNSTLTKFLKPGMNPKERAEAISKGVEAEKKLLSFWDDSKPRVNYTPSSSAVELIQITPDNRVQVKWRGTPKLYDFLPSSDPFEASLAFQQLVTAPSIGKAVMPFQRKGVMLNFKDKNNAWWNRKHYDASKAR